MWRSADRGHSNMADTIFHTRANAVRAESRMLMQKLRAERMAVSRHRPGRAAKAAAAAKPAAARAPAPAQAAASILPSRKVTAAMTPTPVVVEAAPAPAPAPTPKAVKKAAPKVAKATPAPAKVSRPTAAKKTPAAPVAIELPPPVALAPKAPEGPIANPAPLSQLPALGPGMVWRLNQIGVATVGDLASASPDVLRDKLGAIAKLIRAETLIGMARSHARPRPSI
jgi:hypothetical protein